MTGLITEYEIDVFFFFSSRRRHTRCSRDWSSDVCSSDLREKSSDLPIEGRATFTIDTSRIVMKKAAHTTVSAFQRSGSACIEMSSPVVLSIVERRTA